MLTSCLQLFITNQEKTDPFLIQDSTDNAIQGLLTDGSMTAISKSFTSSGLPASAMSEEVFVDRDGEAKPTNININIKPISAQTQKTQKASASAPRVQSPPNSNSNPNPKAKAKAIPTSTNTHTPPPAPTATATKAPAAAVPPPTQAKTHSEVKSRASPPTPPAAAAGPTSGIFTATIIKGEHGIGLDIGKVASGECMIKKLKVMPEGVVNPAASCSPALLPGDMIIGVNGKRVKTFAETVPAIKAAVGTVQLTIERNAAQAL